MSNRGGMVIILCNTSDVHFPGSNILNDLAIISVWLTLNQVRDTQNELHMLFTMIEAKTRREFT